MLLTIGFIALLSAQCGGADNLKDNSRKSDKAMEVMDKDVKLDTATFGEGCFWCTEAVFQDLKGVHAVKSGYSGGATEKPSYEEVCSGNTGHAEVCQVLFDPKVISYKELLEVFWVSHDPTTLNRQGNDVGTQYRSVIFYHNDEQKKIAEASMIAIQDEKVFDRPVVTQVMPFKVFYSAEDYHQDYFNNNPNNRYCTFVIAPKVEKIKKIFKDKLKTN